MFCPKCRKEQPDSPTCIYCHIVLEKYFKLFPPASINSGPLPANNGNDAPGADAAAQKTDDIVTKYNQMRQSMADSESEDAAAHEKKRIVHRKMLLLSFITILITTAVNILIFHGMAKNPTAMLSAENTATTVGSRESDRVPESSLPAPLQGTLNLPHGETPITSPPSVPNQPSSFPYSQPSQLQLAAAPPPQGNRLQDTEPGRNTLRKFEVPYRSYGNSEKRVIVNVLFNNSVTAPIAIDTGAPRTIISARLAERLGLFNEDQGRLLIQAGGIGGRAPAVRTIIDSMEVGGARLEFIPTTVLINAISDSFDGLLGLDFVGNYSVTIDARRTVVVFEEIPSDSERPGGHDRAWWTSNFAEFVDYRDAWQSYSKRLETINHVSMQSAVNNDVKRKEFADQQVRAAEKLLDNLHHYASQQAVPTQWRRY